MNPTTVSLFCGAGGESVGKHLAFEELGIPASEITAHAINHWDLAVATHGLNLPAVMVHQEDITRVTARTYGLKHIELLWASPSCIHHSRARGGKPREEQQRSHAWEVVDRWLRTAQVDVLLIENVPEFEQWGPLGEDGQPIKERKGETFQAFVGDLRSIGYQVEWRVLCAADYGDPTTRRRFFLQAVRDGRPIVWPEATHRDPRKPATLQNRHLPPWRAAAECIDWSLPCPSIFDRKRPLAEATMRRIATGVVRFVLQGKPFLVTCNHADPSFRGQGVDQPISTVTAAHDARGVVVPSMAPFIANTSYTGTTGRGSYVYAPGEPLRTITGSHNGHAVVTPFLAGVGGRMGQGHTSTRGVQLPLPTLTTKADGAIVAPCLVQTSYGERKGQAPRVLDLHQPLGTVVAGGQKHGLVAAFLSKAFGGPSAIAKQPPGIPMTSPMGTVTARDHHNIVEATLERMGEVDGNRSCQGTDREACDRGAPGRNGVEAQEHERDVAGGAEKARNEDQARIPGSARESGREGVHDGGTQAGLGGAARTNPAGSRHQPQGRQSNSESPRQHRDRNQGRESSSLVSGTAPSLGTEVQEAAGSRNRSASDCTSTNSDELQQDRGDAGHLADRRIQGLREGELSRAREVAAFILKFYGRGTGQKPTEPMHTITTIARLGLVTVELDGASYVVTDIGLRMLEPRELALAMGFPTWYRWEHADGSPLSKRDAIKMIGNACPVGTVKALIKAVVLQRPMAFGLEAA